MRLIRWHSTPDLLRLPPRVVESGRGTPHGRFNPNLQRRSRLIASARSRHARNDNIRLLFASAKTYSYFPVPAPIATPLDDTDRGSVWIEPSVADQARTLVQVAAQSSSMPFAAAVADRPLRLGVLSGGGRENDVAAAAASDEARRVGAVIVAQDSASAANLAAFRQASLDAVLVFASGEQTLQFLAAIKALDWHPVLLGRSQQLGAVLRDPALDACAAAFLVTSYGGVDPRSRGAYDFRRVVGELGGGHPELLRDAYVGVKLFERSLGTAGPALTRARLRDTIAGITDFTTGVLPPLSFGADASRRAAARVMWVDPARKRLVSLESFHPS